MGQSICCINKCEKPRFGKYLCNMHYSRLRNTGTTDLRPRPKKKCRMPGCEKPSRKNRWCNMHHQRIVKNGSPFDRDQKWVIKDYKKCVVCGERTGKVYGMKRYCGNSCAVLASQGDRPKEKSCVSCGNTFSLVERNPETGRMRYSSASTCLECSRHPNLSRYTSLLVDRDGIECYLCESDIDLSVEYPNPMSRQVDHVIPRHVGGLDHIDNYRLVHMKCNLDKRYHSGMLF